jgi:hypothetical protein
MSWHPIGHKENIYPFPTGHRARIFPFTAAQLVTKREYTRFLASYWLQSQNIPIYCHPIGHKERIFPFSSFLLVTNREYSQFLASYCSRSKNIPGRTLLTFPTRLHALVVGSVRFVWFFLNHEPFEFREPLGIEYLHASRVCANPP